MKFVIGIILIALLILALVGYLILMLNAHEMVFCGDIANTDGASAYMTRIYTTDLSADETLSEIVLTMNNSEDGAVPVDQLTEILATYQNIIYAPVFSLALEKADENTYVLSGSIYDGITEDGEPAQPDYTFKDLSLTAAIANGAVLAAQNVYPPDEDGDPEFVERKLVVDPIVTDENRGAAFAFSECDSFRLVFTATGSELPSVTLVYTYDVQAVNPLDFTGLEDGLLACTYTVAYNESGKLEPVLKMERMITADDTDD